MVTRALFDVIKVDYSPPDRTASSANPIIPMYAGDLILAAYVIPIVLGTTANTVTLGITGEIARFTASYDTSTGTVGTPIDGTTAIFPDPALADQNLIVDYIVAAGGGTITPKTRFVVVILRAPRF